jgi:hypothetical protein
MLATPSRQGTEGVSTTLTPGSARAESQTHRKRRERNIISCPP